jgi:hypothetical protein
MNTHQLSEDSAIFSAYIPFPKLNKRQQNYSDLGQRLSDSFLHNRTMFCRRRRRTDMKAFAKTALLAAGVASLAVATTAQARGYYHDRDRIDAGDVIAGVLILGGIAAVASSISNKDSRYDGYGRDRYRDRGYDRGYGYNDGYRYNSRAAVEQCVRAARNKAQRYGWARVTDVTSIDRIRGGYVVRGRLVVEERGNRYNGWGRGYDQGYGRSWDRNDRYGYHYNNYNDGYDKGRFECVAQYGGVRGVDLSGLRGGY